jgi:hypothetical protein
MEADSMPVAVDYELAIREAEKALKDAQTAGDVRNAWKRHLPTLGHRTLGRLLMGQEAAALLAKHPDAKD